MVSLRNPLIRYVLRRLATYLLTMYLAVTFTFFVLRLIPGNPVMSYVQALLSQGQYSVAEEAQKIVDEYMERFGLKGDIFTQYVRFMERLVLHFDLGPSLIAFPRSVQSLILERLPWTIGLLGTATLISWALGTLLGAFAGWREGSWADKLVVAVALALSQIPFYITAVLLILVFGYIITSGPLHFPTGGAYDPRLTPSLTPEFVLSVIRHSVLPAASLVLSSLFGWLLSMRSLMITVLGEDFLRFAEAKGLKKSVLFRRYALRNTLLPQVTGLGMSLGFVVSGSILVEVIFRYPGVGYLFSVALTNLDYNLIMGFVILTIFTVLTANLILDLIYPLIDPRVSYSE